jgi:RNA polymerase Rpb3/Rpb11 dimerisation domain
MDSVVADIKTTLHAIPEIKQHFVADEISFKLLNSACPIANTLRTVAISALPVKHLMFDITKIDTNVKLVPDELLLRISSIPINQDAKGVYKLALKGHHGYHKSNEIQGGDKLCNPGHRLIYLKTGEYVNINNITVEERNTYCDTSAESSNKTIPVPELVQHFEYEVLDYIMVNIFIDGFVNHKYIHKSDLAMKGKVLYYTNKDELPTLTEFFNIKNKKTSNINKTNDFYDNFVYKENLKSYDTTEIEPKEFHLSFETYGTISSRELVKRACMYIVNLVKDLPFQIFDDRIETNLKQAQIAFLLLHAMRVNTKLKCFTNMKVDYFNEEKIKYVTDFPDKKQLFEDAKKAVVDVMKKIHGYF